MNEKIDRATSALVSSYNSEHIRIDHLDRQPLPSHAEIIRILVTIHELLFPGYIGRQDPGPSVQRHVETRMLWLYEALTEQISRAVRHGTKKDMRCETQNSSAAEIAEEFLLGLADLRKVLAGDVRAAYQGDPAARCLDEVIFCYPGIYAVMVYRVAHELFKMRVPLLPRTMTEHAHHRTGIDIHPGTAIGERFFIDHGSGVVIGGTAVIGNNVKLYQGVTIGAFSFDLDADGQVIRNTKRHPTIEDDVVIYAGATILGGDTVIGRGSIIGGNVWLTHSVPPGTRVAQESPNLRFIPSDEIAV